MTVGGQPEDQARAQDDQESGEEGAAGNVSVQPGDDFRRQHGDAEDHQQQTEYALDSQELHLTLR